MEKEIICIVCPKGCKISARLRSENAASYEISGHSCTRGYEYAISECTNPVRTLTTTVRLLCGEGDGVRHTGGIRPVLVPVKSSAPLPKDLLKECMKAVNSAAARPPVRIGDVIIRDILGTGADIIATANITGEEHRWISDSSSRSTRGRQAQGRSSSTASAEK